MHTLHTPIACTIMGWSFGMQSGYIRIAFHRYMASGPVGIYHSQIVKGLNIIYIKIKRKKTGQFLI
jgi:hypothetical protein